MSVTYGVQAPLDGPHELCEKAKFKEDATKKAEKNRDAIVLPDPGAQKVFTRIGAG